MRKGNETVKRIRIVGCENGSANRLSLSFSECMKRLFFLNGRIQIPLHEKSGKKPKWCIVKADDSFQVVFCPAIIPWTVIVLF